MHFTASSTADGVNSTRGSHAFGTSLLAFDVRIRLNLDFNA